MACCYRYYTRLFLTPLSSFHALHLSVETSALPCTSIDGIQVQVAHYGEPPCMRTGRTIPTEGSLKSGCRGGLQDPTGCHRRSLCHRRVAAGEGRAVATRHVGSTSEDGGASPSSQEQAPSREQKHATPRPTSNTHCMRPLAARAMRRWFWGKT